MSAKRLFQPLKLGNVQLQHRMAMAPLTRLRADADHVPADYAKEYYGQRASVPGTLLITEATAVSPRAAGYKSIPGIWSDAQIRAWAEIVQTVHAKGSRIFLQLWALGRVAKPEVLEEEGGYKLQGASSIASPGGPTPEELTEETIHILVQDFQKAAKNAIKAGFDGVEVHGANGYLIDQFWQDVSNQRTDKYGGSIENRARFGLDVTKAVIEAVGDSKKVAIRLSPFNTFQGMRMENPIPQFVYITQELRKLDLAYLHLVESSIAGAGPSAEYKAVNEENSPLVEAWDNVAPILLAGGFDAAKAIRIVNEVYPDRNILVVFGRHFLATPDLPYRIQHGLDLNPQDRSTFYGGGRKGYIDYPFSKEFLAQASSA